MNIAINLAERGLVPDLLLRSGIKTIIKGRLASEQRRHSTRDRALGQWTSQMRESPVALVPDQANRQHYEVPAAFFQSVLGPHLKYSSGLWEQGTTTLADAERRMLELTVQRAQLHDGQRILELGCGWGSLTLWMAEALPNATITAVSNSHSQRIHIEAEARLRGLENVQIVTSDMNGFEAVGRFDRIVSVEMFEHMRNWEALLSRCHAWLKDEGKMFMHVFAHRSFAYPFETVAEDDWMGRNFFTGGMMPSADLLDQLNIPFSVERRWEIDGTHYQKTADAWADNLKACRSELLTLLEPDLGSSGARRMLQRWHIFFRACSELFGFASGTEWMVCHFMLSREHEGALR